MGKPWAGSTKRQRINPPEKRKLAMATITVTHSNSTAPIPPDLSTASIHYDDPWKRDLTALLILLGQKLIQHELHEEWLSMGQVTNTAGNTICVGSTGHQRQKNWRCMQLITSPKPAMSGAAV
jgi:hypothetical protein